LLALTIRAPNPAATAIWPDRSGYFGSIPSLHSQSARRRGPEQSTAGNETESSTRSSPGRRIPYTSLHFLSTSARCPESGSRWPSRTPERYWVVYRARHAVARIEGMVRQGEARHQQFPALNHLCKSSQSRVEWQRFILSQ